MTQETFKKLTRAERDLVIRGPAKMLAVLLHRHKLDSDKLERNVRLTKYGSDFPHKTPAQMEALQHVRDSMLFERESDSRIFCAWVARMRVSRKDYLMYDKNVREIIASCPVPPDVQARIYNEYIQGLKLACTPPSTYRTGDHLATIAFNVVRCIGAEICVQSEKC